MAISKLNTEAAKAPKALVSFYGWLTLEIWFLIALGGGVRAMNAGLACPDWPLCFGDYIPDYHPQVYLEFVHRFMAGAIGLMTAGLTIWMLRAKGVAKELKVLSGFAVLLLVAQIVLGALTVLWLLHEKVVAAHLFLATTFFATNLWIYLSLRKNREGMPAANEDIRAAPATIILAGGFTLLVLGQILLGGLVASHSAALVCVEFPLCHGQWFPTFSGTIGLQVLHRLGAYIIAALALVQFLIFRKSNLPMVRQSSLVILSLVALQMALGIANVLFLTPPLITIAHLATAIAILGFSIRTFFVHAHYGLGESGWLSGWASIKGFKAKQV